MNVESPIHLRVHGLRFLPTLHQGARAGNARTFVRDYFGCATYGSQPSFPLPTGAHLTRCTQKSNVIYDTVRVIQ